jgi:hypothetical protein
LSIKKVDFCCSSSSTKAQSIVVNDHLIES